MNAVPNKFKCLQCGKETYKHYEKCDSCGFKKTIYPIVKYHLKKWLEFDYVKATKLQYIKFQVNHLFELATKNAHVLDESEYMKLFAHVSFETLYWLIEQSEKVERYEKTLEYYASLGSRKAKEALEDYENEN